VNKADLIDVLVRECDLSKAAAQRALDCVTNNVIQAVAKGEGIQIFGFGSFSAGKRAARTGRNPRTGEEITIAASKTVKFTAGKAFKDALKK
jgi:DNA-binding protein HU-beta